MWLDTKVPVTVKLISQITRYPMQGHDPSQYFCDKDNDNPLVSKMKKKYGMDHDKREYVFDTINYRTVWVVAKNFPIKLVRKNHPNQCTFGVIACAEWYEEECE